MRTVTIAVAASVALVITVAATNSVVSAARAITRDSSALSQTDGAIRSATVARTLTVLAAVAVQDGSTPRSLAEAQIAATDLASRSEPSSPAAAFVEAADSAIAQLRNGIPASPQQIALVENTFQTLLSNQLSRRADLATALNGSQKMLNRMSTLAGVALLFIVPAVSIFVYRGLTKPDLTHARLIHQADIEQETARNRLLAISGEITKLRRDLQRASTIELSHRLAELSALAGSGVDGDAHDRTPVDVRGAIAKAVLRLDSSTAITVSGDMALALTDESQLVTLLDSLIGCLDGLESPAVVVKRLEGNVVVSISGVGHIEPSSVLDGPRLWDHRPASTLDIHLTAARSIAEGLGARIRRVDNGERSGVKILLPGVSQELTEADASYDSTATAA